MKRVVEKLKCRRGASILLALLFLLVCVLVAMSVLMAAASNAGKIRSNREEQQKYFTLSSALNLVVGELEKAEYRGQYSITSVHIPAEVDNTTTPPTVKRAAYYEYSGKQIEGNFTCELNKTGSPVLPLQNDLDALFYAQYRPPDLSVPDQWMGFGEKDGAGTLTSSPYTLELQVNSPPEDGKGLTQIVVITVTVSPSSGDITLEAKLKDEEYYSTLQAELRAQINSGAFDLEVGGTKTDPPVTWKLDKITKKKEGP